MKKKLILIMTTLLAVSTFMTACSSSSATKADASNPKDTKNTVASSSSKEVPAPSSDPKEDYTNGYDYILYGVSESDTSSEKSPILGFNYPYKADYSDNSTFAPTRYNFSTNHLVEMDSETYIQTDALMITSEEYEIAQENTEVEEKGKIETPYGTANLYFTKTHETYDEGSYDSYAEVATLNIGTNTVTLTWHTFNDNTTYLGKLEKLIPILFTPINISESEKPVIEKNKIRVDDSYDVYLLGGRYGGDEVTVLGFNPFNETDGWQSYASSYLPGDESNCYEYIMREPYDLAEDDTEKKHGTFTITTNPGYYNYFFGGRGTISMEEKSSVQTPFGVAKIYYGVREECEIPEKEEVAILNNRGTNIIFEYQPYSLISDGNYDGKLEEFIPELFE